MSEEPREGREAMTGAQSAGRGKDPRDPVLRARNRALMAALLALVALLFAISLIRMSGGEAEEWRRFDTGPEETGAEETGAPAPAPEREAGDG